MIDIVCALITWESEEESASGREIVGFELQSETIGSTPELNKITVDFSAKS